MGSEIHWKSIRQIRDKLTDITVELSSCSIQKIAAKYSNTKIPIYKLLLANKPVSRNNSYVVSFICPNCSTQREITLNLFMRRIQRDTKTCYICVNKDEDKCNTHRTFMIENKESISHGDYIAPSKVTTKSLQEHLDYSIDCWKKEDPQFCEQYSMAHLSIEEFERILPKIQAVGNDKLTDLTEWVYFPHYRVFNQTRYTPMLVNSIKKTIEKPQYITFECENCGINYKHRDLEIVKNKLKMYCQGCSLSNMTFKIRHYTLQNGTKILWQSNPEKRFIEWCEANSIQVQNGPSINYSFQDKIRTYRVDFELPEYKKLIEIKDNHCWHRQQLASGKFGAKELAAQSWSAEKGYTYEVIFPKTLQQFKDTLLSTCKI